MDDLRRRIEVLEQRRRDEEFSQTYSTIQRHIISTIPEDRNFENLKRATLDLDLTLLKAHFNKLSEYQKLIFIM